MLTAQSETSNFPR